MRPFFVSRCFFHSAHYFPLYQKFIESQSRRQGASARDSMRRRNCGFPPNVERSSDASTVTVSPRDRSAKVSWKDERETKKEIASASPPASSERKTFACSRCPPKRNNFSTRAFPIRKNGFGFPCPNGANVRSASYASSFASASVRKPSGSRAPPRLIGVGVPSDRREDSS